MHLQQLPLIFSMIRKAVFRARSFGMRLAALSESNPALVVSSSFNILSKFPPILDLLNLFRSTRLISAASSKKVIMLTQGNSKYAVQETVLHCSAIQTGQFKGFSPFQVFATINKWHHERGFKNGFGYHGLIMPDGHFYSGRPLTMIGAHVMGHNAGTWGILLIESVTIKKIGEFSDFYTKAQAHTLRSWLKSYPQIKRVSGHNDYANKLCPGFKVQSSDWL